MTPDGPLLSAVSLTKAYPTRSGELIVLRDCTLALDRGQSAAIRGPSGSGKSTLLSILGTLEMASGGRFTIDRFEPQTLSAAQLAEFRNQRIGFVFQDHYLLPQCNTLENVLVPTLVQQAGTDRTARARELLARVGLSQRLEHLPAELSGGERQRTALARALINQPAVVLADEPTGNLDRATAESVADLLIELQAAERFALVVVTHSERMAQRFGRQYELIDGVLRAA